jgi:hypothetical protein
MEPARLTKAVRGTYAVPADVAAAIKSAPKTQGVYEVTLNRQYFTGKILKVDVLTFHERCGLVLSNFNEDWIAVVAKKIQFVEPENNNSIATEANWNPARYGPPPAPPQPPKAPKGDTGDNGGDGAAGYAGSPGHPGDSGPKVPDVYLIVGAFVNKFDQPLPQSLNFIFDLRGYSGGDGGNGGAGGNGGDGGDGGPANWHDPAQYPFDPGCKGGAGYGGWGAPGGQGGPGGVGGNASNGGNLIWAAPQDVQDSLVYARVFNQGGLGGSGGTSGPSGRSGSGGARGEARGTCNGGLNGFVHPTPATPSTQAPGGQPTNPGSNDGQINQEVDDNIDKYF